MLRRVTSLGSLAPIGAAEGEATNTAAADQTQNGAVEAFAPVETLDGYGVLRSPPPTAEAIPASKIATAEAGLTHPPGYYGAQEHRAR